MVLREESPEHSIIAMLSAILFIQNPTLSVEQLQQGISSASQHICSWLETQDLLGPDLAASQIN